ncbi:hypothetical protein JCM9279_006626 [Rhodotorula babjevae]
MAKRARTDDAPTGTPFAPRDPAPDSSSAGKHQPASHAAPNMDPQTDRKPTTKLVAIAPAPAAPSSSSSLNPPLLASTSTTSDEPPKKKKAKKSKAADAPSLSSNAAASSSSASAARLDPTLDPTLAGLLRDEPHKASSAFPAGDIPVDPSLMQLADVATAPAPAPPPSKKERKHKDKKDKGKAKAADAGPDDEGAHLETPAAPTAAAAVADTSSTAAEKGEAPVQVKEKKRRGRPPKVKDAAGGVAPQASGSAPPALLPVPVGAAGSALHHPPAPLAGSAAANFYEDLVTKWMSSKQLKEMAESAGATYSSGKFTTTEDAAIDTIVAAFCAERSYTPDDFRAFLVVKRAVADKQAQRADTHDLWERLGRALRTRPLLAIYNHVRARYPAPDAFVAKGERWTPEDDERLRAAVVEMGNSWERVGTAVGRAATSCRDRWTKQLVGGQPDKKKTGAWTGDEEEQLRALVQEHGNSWKIVSEKMGGTRSATQCRTKWNDYLKRRDVFSTTTPAAATAADDANDAAPDMTPAYKWRPEDSSRLVHLIASHQPPAHSLADLPWAALTPVDPELEPHGTKNLRDRFRTLASYAARAIRVERGWGEGEEVAFSDILPRLIAQHPTPTGKPLRRPRADPKPKLPKPPPAAVAAAAAAAAAGTGADGKGKKGKKAKGKGVGVGAGVGVDVGASEEAEPAPGAGESGRAAARAKGAYKSKETVETEDEASGEGEDDVDVAV